MAFLADFWEFLLAKNEPPGCPSHPFWTEGWGVANPPSSAFTSNPAPNWDTLVLKDQTLNETNNQEKLGYVFLSSYRITSHSFQLASEFSKAIQVEGNSS